MRQACDHADSIQPVPDPRDVCEACIVEGTHWVHLRQCLSCGQTLCCDNSPRRHMSGHWKAVGHPVMRGVSEGDDWTWCFPHDASIRATAGRWETYDPFVEFGTAVAAERLVEGMAEPGPDFVTDDGFPLGDWMVYVREVHEAGELDPADAAAIEAIPGWRWGAGAA
jgi:ubiquitin-hydrolase Zn-finger-containing protein